MPKEVNLTGDQVLALTRKYSAAEDVAFITESFDLCDWPSQGSFRRVRWALYCASHQCVGILATLARCGNGCLRFSAWCGWGYPCNADDLEREFGTMRVIVDRVTKFGQGQVQIPRGAYGKTIATLMAMSEDIRAILVKLQTVSTICGRWRSAQGCGADFETMEIYAPGSSPRDLCVKGAGRFISVISMKWNSYKISYMMKGEASGAWRTGRRGGSEDWDLCWRVNLQW